MQFLTQVINGVADAWRRLSTSARVNLVAASVFTVIVVLAVVFLQVRPQYVPLYTGLDLSESGEIQGYLTDQSIPFTTQDGGRTILVPIDRRSQAKVDLAAQGLPTRQGGTKGWEIFDQQSLLTNDHQQDIQYQRAVAGELMRQLNEFDFVRKSVAYISMPKDELFRDNAENARAAVTLDIRRPLSREEIKGVLQVISAYGGARLSPQHITLMTTDGQALHVPVEEGSAAIASTKLDYIERLEGRMEEKIRGKLLEMGAARAVVSVSADVDFSTEKTTYEEVLDGVATITNTTESEVENAPASEGAPGMTSNAPQGVVPNLGNRTTETTTETTENIEPSRRTTETLKEPGTVRQWSVSAAIDTGRRKRVEGTDGEPLQEYDPMTEEERTMYRTMIAKAVGPELTPEMAEVFDMPFNLEGLGSVDRAFKEVQTEITGIAVRENAIIILKLLLVLLGILAVLRFFRRALVTVEVPETAEAPRPTAPPEEVRKRQIASELERVSQDNPETVAALLRSWMTEAEE